jgi:cystathionine beta-synthase
MTTKLTKLSAESNIDQLIPLFAKDMVAIVVDSDEKYLGLITKIDLINHLRKQLPR